MEDENRLILGVIGFFIIIIVLMISTPIEVIESIIKTYWKPFLFIIGIIFIIIALVSEDKHNYCESNYTNRVTEANRYRK